MKPAKTDYAPYYETYISKVETDNPVVVAYIREYTEESCWYSTAEAMPSRPRRLPRRIRGR